MLFDVRENNCRSVELEEQGTSRLDAFSAQAIKAISKSSDNEEQRVKSVLQILVFRKKGGLSCHLGNGGPSPLISLSVTVAKSANRELRGACDSTTIPGGSINPETIELRLKIF